MRKRCISVLVKIEKPAVKPIIRLTGDSETEMRNCAIDVLKELQDPESINPLVHLLLADKNAVVRGNAAEALGRFSNPAIVNPMITALKDKDAVVRQSAAETLGNIKDKKALGRLIDAVKDPNFGVREEAVIAIGKLNDPSAIEPLISMLKDEDKTVCAEAFKALCIMDDSRAQSALIDAINNDPDIKSNVKAVMGDLRDFKSMPAIVKIMSSESTQRKEVSQDVVKNPKKRAPREVVSNLTSEDSNIRCQAAETLGNIGDIYTVVPLILALEDEKDENVKQKLISSLQQITGQKITNDAEAWRKWWRDNKYKYL